MAVIQQLDKKLIEKIAAGEVVERPASVIKELIENSLDAGATSITVEIRDGGLTFMRVTDNGCGMDEADAIFCFSPHATSKIKDEADLLSIATLGFRGEALSSICAVSKVTLETRERKSETGIEIQNHGGDIISNKKSGKPEGTTIIVEELFYNIPARLKFAKKPAAESAVISSMVLQYILARPKVSFRFISNGKDVYRSNGDGELLNAIYAVYGAEVSDHMVPMHYEFEDIKISGYIGDSQLVRASKNFQSLFVNGRYIKNDQVANGVKQGYLNRIMPAKFPVFVLNLTVPYEGVDVNVHPNKLEVRFVQNDLIVECFYKGTKQALDAHYTTPTPVQQQTNVIPIDRIHEEPKVLEPAKAKPAPSHEAVDFKTSINNNVSTLFPPQPKKSGIMQQTPMKVLSKVVETAKKPEKQQHQTVLLPEDNVFDYRIIGQLFLTYILIEYKDNFLMIDQHAAHERINTNILMKQLEDKQVVSQNLLFPYILKVTAQDHQQILEHIDYFEELGFTLDDFGDSTIKITSLPHILGEPQVKDFFLEAVDKLGQLSQGKVELKKQQLFQTACKHSIKGGEKLSNDEIRYLITETMEHRTPLHCPHGRPIVIVKTKAEIEKMFGRIV